MHEKSKALQYLMELKNKRSHENMSSEVYGKSLSVFVYLLIFFSSCVCVANVLIRQVLDQVELCRENI